MVCRDRTYSSSPTNTMKGEEKSTGGNELVSKARAGIFGKWCQDNCVSSSLAVKNMYYHTSPQLKCLRAPQLRNADLVHMKELAS
jgi:hypothetical protein